MNLRQKMKSGANPRIMLYYQAHKLRKQGLLQREIAKKLGIPKPTIQSWLSCPPKYVTGEPPKKFWWKKHIPNYSDEEKKLIALGIDFEGCIGIYNWRRASLSHLNGKSIQPLIAVASTSKPLIEYWINLVQVGKITRIIPNARLKKGWKDAYYWRICARGEVIGILKQVQKYLVAKKKQSRVVIDFVEGRISAEEARRLMSTLNRKGRPLKEFSRK